MGEHITFIMKCQVKKDAPEQVIKTLEYMTNLELLNSVTNFKAPAHRFFECEGWQGTLWGVGGEVWDPKSSFEFDFNKNTYFLDVRTSVKWGYEEIRLFLHWLAPYSASQGVVGHYLPEYNRQPSRVLFEDGKAYLIEPVENYEGLEDLAEDNKEARYIAMLESMVRGNLNMAEHLNEELKQLKRNK